MAESEDIPYQPVPYDPNTYSCCDYYNSRMYEEWRDYYPTCMRSYPMPKYPGLTLKAGNKLILPEPEVDDLPLGNDS